MTRCRRAIALAAHGTVGALGAIALLAGSAGAQISGDADCNGSIDSSDITAALEALFTSTECTAADANADGAVTAPDVVAVVLVVAASTPVATPTTTPPASTPTPTATTPAGREGPEITFFGLVNADGCAACDVPNCLCLGTPTRTPEIDGQGRRVFEASFGSGFLLVVEGQPGAGRFPVGTFVPAPIPGSPLRPDLQIVSDHDLGDGGDAICLNDGVPGISPLSFEERADVTDAMIDLACRFEARLPTQSCTLNSVGASSVVTPGGLPPDGRQFCLVISNVLAFAAGSETAMAVRLADTSGAVGAPREIVVRVRQP